MKKKIFCLPVVAFILLLSFPNSLFAVGSAGFENASFSAKALGQSKAVVAKADDPAAISYNPAGIVYLPGFQFQPNVSLISSFTYYNSSIQPHTRSSGTIVPVPTGYMTLNPGELLGDRVAFGIGSDSPFGLSNKYDGGHGIARYTGYVNYLKMYTVKPTVSFKLLDWLSIGGGPMWYRVFDYGGIQAYPNVLGGGTTDGQVRLNLAGNHWGWQAGILAKPHKMHQFGFYFRSPVVVKTRGLAKVENTLFTAGGRYETGVDSKVPLPLNFTFAYAFKPTDRTTVETDFGYTKWSIFKRAPFTHNRTTISALDNTILAAIGVPNDKDYSNGFSAHLGGNHKFTDRFTVLGGTLFYWKVVPKDHWIPAVPDSNRLGFSLGTSYKISKYLVADLTYFTWFVLHRRIQNDIGATLGTSVDGKYKGYLQEVTVSLTYKWDDLFTKLSKKDKSGKVEAPRAEAVR